MDQKKLSCLPLGLEMSISSRVRCNEDWMDVETLHRSGSALQREVAGCCQDSEMRAQANGRRPRSIRLSARAFAREVLKGKQPTQHSANARVPERCTGKRSSPVCGRRQGKASRRVDSQGAARLLVSRSCSVGSFSAPAFGGFASRRFLSQDVPGW